MIRMPRILREQFQTRRSRLLYFVYCANKGRIKNAPGIKSKLCKIFGYKSDGHFYHDLKYLIDSGLLIEENGYYRITKKGKAEFLLLNSLKIGVFVSVILGILSIYYYWALKTSAPIYYESVLILGISLIMIGVLYYITRKRFMPDIPQDARELLK